MTKKNDPVYIMIAAIIIIFLFKSQGTGLNISLPSFNFPQGGGSSPAPTSYTTPPPSSSTPPPIPSISLSFGAETYQHDNSATGSVTSNVANGHVIIEEKLYGDTDAYDVSGWPHTWVQVFSGNTDSSGSFNFPYTCARPGLWQIRATITDYGISDTENIEVTGVLIEIPEDSYSAGDRIEIRVFSNIYNDGAFLVYETLNNWVDSDIMSYLGSDAGGHTHVTLITGSLGLHKFKVQAPNGVWSYNEESCTVN